MCDCKAGELIVLDDRFNLQQFSDFILAQRPLPPDQLAEAADKQFVPAHAVH